MSEPASVTKFQRDAEVRLVDVLGAPLVERELIIGKREAYIRAVAGPATLYLYEDACEWVAGARRQIFEIADFKSDDELIDAFVAAVRRIVVDSETG